MKNRLSSRLSEQDVQASILYRDGLILIINKPSGIPVHNAGGSNHNLEQYFHILQFGLPKPPTLAHRLDLGTSGCLALARNAHGARVMQQLFTEGRIKKTYIADVRGLVKEDTGHITVPLSKISQEKKHWWMKADPLGSITAHTEFQVISRHEQNTRLRLIPHTGRTHQLRVHCASIGHPIIGDYIYGEDQHFESGFFLHLHAQIIEIPLYPKKLPIRVSAPLPSHMGENSACR
jgi:RluA family pseudouridine synthase